MRAARLILLVAVSVALLGGGLLPEHLHRSSTTEAPFAHSHLGDHDHHGAADVADDDHEHVVDLDQAIAGGPRQPRAEQPAEVLVGLQAPEPSTAPAAFQVREPAVTASPPWRSIAPRAPPA